MAGGPCRAAGTIGPPPARLAAEAKAVLAAHCYRCHGKDGVNEGSFGSVLDRRRLVESKQVVPGDAPKSRLLRRVTAGEMPPPEKVQLPAADVDALKRWVAAGAPDWSAPVERKAIVLADEIRFAAADLAKQKTGPGARPQVMYFSLTTLYNAGAPDDELEETRAGFFKLLNSFSSKPAIVLPEAVNPEKTVYRVEPEAFGRSSFSADGHPFGLTVPLRRSSSQVLRRPVNGYPCSHSPGRVPDRLDEPRAEAGAGGPVRSGPGNRAAVHSRREAARRPRK